VIGLPGLIRRALIWIALNARLGPVGPWILGLALGRRPRRITEEEARERLRDATDMHSMNREDKNAGERTCLKRARVAALFCAEMRAGARGDLRRMADLLEFCGAAGVD
jgi:hypothetical protein